MGPRTGLDGCGKSGPNGIRSPDRPASSESLYRLRYRGPHTFEVLNKLRHFLPSEVAACGFWGQNSKGVGWLFGGVGEETGSV